MIITRITGPSIEPVSLERAKIHLRVTSDSEDDYIASLIKVGRERLEAYLGRAFIQQVWELRLSGWRFASAASWGGAGLGPHIDIPRPPTMSIDSVKYFDLSNVEQTLASTEYIFIDGGDSDYSYLQAADGVTLPDTYPRADAVRIRFTAGYSYDSDASPPQFADQNVPEIVNQAILLLVGTYFENREQASWVPLRQEIQPMPMEVGIFGLCESLKVPRL